MPCSAGRIHGHHFEALIMKVRDIIANFTIPQDNGWYDADWDDLCGGRLDSYGYDYQKFVNAVKEYHIVSWICTDTRVGLSIIALNGEIVGMGYQSARKSGKDIEYVSKDAYNKLQEFMLTCLPSEECSILDMDEEVEFPQNNEWRTVEFSHFKVTP